MAYNYSKTQNNKVTPQDSAIPGRENEMVENNAGGVTFKLDKWVMLRRFLILGSEGGSYYASPKKLTEVNIDNVKECIKEDGVKVIEIAAGISNEGRAPKNDPAIFILALVFTYGDNRVKRNAIRLFNNIVRTGTHLFTFVHYVDEMRGWGRAIRTAIARWYNRRDPKQLEYQIVKYQGRTVEGTGNKWTHRDVLRSAHVKPDSDEHNNIFRYAVKGEYNVETQKLISGVESLKIICSTDNPNIKNAISMIEQGKIPHEAWPTELKKHPEVWEAALKDMPLTATIRNLGRLTNIGVLAPMSPNVKTVLKKIGDAEYIKKSRVHPMNILVAMKTYAQGRGMRGKLIWDPVTKIIDALDEAFYLAFDNVESSGKRTLIALDVSGSMTSEISTNPFLSCREASAAMALLTMRKENYEVIGFTGGGTYYRGNQDINDVSVLNISPKMRLDTVIKNISNLSFSGTDCALPMIWANVKKLDFDTIVVYTDNETWAGKIQPSQALQRYRNDRGLNTKLIVVGMNSNDFSIADPRDSGMLDVVGFDTAAPNIISDFSKGVI